MKSIANSIFVFPSFRSTLLLLLLLCSLSLSAQNPLLEKGLSWEPSWLLGKVQAHSPKFRQPITELTTGMELHLSWQSYGKKKWHAWQRFPKFGLGLLYLHHGDNPTYGSAVGVYPDIVVPFNNSQKRFHAWFRGGFGLAWLSQSYRQSTQNYAIGSNLNAIGAFRVGGQYRISSRWAIQAIASATHFSNGATQLPNLGLNIIGGQIGVSYTPHPLEPADYISHPKEPISKRWRIAALLGIGQLEKGAPLGPKSLVWNLTLETKKQIFQTQRLGLGLMYEYFGWIPQDMDTQGLRDNQFWTASRWSVFASDEFHFGKTSLLAQFGVYPTWAKSNRYSGLEFFYFRVGMRYYLVGKPEKKQSTHIGIYLKAHGGVAEYISIGLGQEF